MTYKLFLDDVRKIRQVYPEGINIGEWIHATSYANAVMTVLKYGCPDFISFDHDLGSFYKEKEKTGYDFAKWLIEKDMDGKIRIPASFSFFVHSANRIGTINIIKLLDNYLIQRK